MEIFVNDLSLIAPGLIEQQATNLVLAGESNWEYQPLPVLRTNLLPANESRRLTAITKLVLKCIQELRCRDEDVAKISTVFSSSDVDLNIVDKMCRSLAKPSKIISPTLFHNSVHNAPAGYWSIAATMQGPSTSVSSGNASFMCGLLEAMSQVMIERSSVFFIAYDYPAPAILNSYRNCEYPMAMALRLSYTAEENNLGKITLKEPMNNKQAMVSKCKNLSLETLRELIPIGCGLPLLEALACKLKMDVNIPYLHEQIFRVEISH